MERQEVLVNHPHRNPRILEYLGPAVAPRRVRPADPPAHAARSLLGGAVVLFSFAYLIAVVIGHLTGALR